MCFKFLTLKESHIPEDYVFTDASVPFPIFLKKVLYTLNCSQPLKQQLPSYDIFIFIDFFFCFTPLFLISFPLDLGKCLHPLFQSAPSHFIVTFLTKLASHSLTDRTCTLLETLIEFINREILHSSAAFSLSVFLVIISLTKSKDNSNFFLFKKQNQTITGRNIRTR